MSGLEEKFEEFAREFGNVDCVALSYSGGLDSAVVGMLLSKAGFRVVPVVADIGQKTDFSLLSKNASSMFADLEFIDAKEEAADAVFRAIKANFGYDGKMNGGGFIRPVLAHALALAARKRGCQAIAHGSSGVGNDHLIMENALRVLAPEMRIMAPVRDLDLRRDESLAFAKKHGLKTNLKRASRISADESIWGRMIRQGVSANPESPLPPDAYKWTAPLQKAPAKPQEIEVGFAQGIPVFVQIGSRKISGKVEILSALNEAGGRHSVGRGEALEDKAVGLKIREAYECPAARILLFAHRALEELTLTARELAAKQQVDAMWASLVRKAGWHTRLRRSLDAFIDEIERPVDGKVRLVLFKGSVFLAGRGSPHALYDSRLSSRDSKAVFSQKEARHYAKLYGFQDLIAYLSD